MRYTTIQIPALDTGHNAEEQVEKMKEAVDEFLNEFCVGRVNKTAALSKMFDVVQVMHGFIHEEAKDILVGEDAHLYVEESFRQANEHHIEDVRRDAAARGWRI